MNQDQFYEKEYEKIFNSGTLGLMSDFMHRFIEKPFRNSDYFDKVLEVGAGHGQHYKFVRHGYDKYLESDLRLLDSVKETEKNSRRMKVQLDAQDLSSVKEISIDRLIATCILVHLPDPEKALQQWKRVMKPGGVISVYVPNEPGILLRLFRNLTTIPKSRKHGFDHKSIHYREHRNMWIFCDLLIQEIFQDAIIERRSFPFKFLPWNLRLFDVYQIKIDESEK